MEKLLWDLTRKQLIEHYNILSKIMKFKYIYIFFISLIIFFSCERKSKQLNSVSKTYVKEITTSKEFEKVINTSKNTLLIIDLYADWCMPCKILGFRMEKLAEKHKTKPNVKFYKINVDKLPQIANYFQVKSIPFVIFVKDNKLVFKLIGLHPASTYQKVINYFSKTKI